MFRETVFAQRADFRGVTFLATALFDHAVFRQLALFRRARFTAEALFSGATFAGEAVFREARFTGPATFRDAAFAIVPAFWEARAAATPGVQRSWPPGWRMVPSPDGLDSAPLVNDVVSIGESPASSEPAPSPKSVEQETKQQ
ncbi:pentapeptide repeat-containing protein [Nonomuraea wenchangensis]|uniref:pentapeptide repeat-containing protein n=1 Tax=Nonomuraea wenchangensis TaxID=568860 RepID=UPI003430C655